MPKRNFDPFAGLAFTLMLAGEPGKELLVGFVRAFAKMIQGFLCGLGKRLSLLRPLRRAAGDGLDQLAFEGVPNSNTPAP